MRVFYFGCVREPGHHMWKPTSDGTGPHWKDYDFLDKNPWGYEIDGGLCPGGERHNGRRPYTGIPEVQGQALIHHKDGWTALSFWDRSVDKRGACNSTFLAEGDFTFEQMSAIAVKYFPEVTKRFHFPVVLYKAVA